MINLSASIDREAFDAACSNIPDDVAEHIAGAYPDLFATCFRYSSDARVVGASPKTVKCEPATAKPKAERKPRAVKEPSEDDARVDATVLMSIENLDEGEGVAPKDIATDLDRKVVAKALQRLAFAGKVKSNGSKGKGVKYRSVCGVAAENA